MRNEGRPLYGAAAGAIAIVLFGAGALIIGVRPDFSAPDTEVAAFFQEKATRIQICAGLDAAAAPFLVWFLATVASLTRGREPDAQRAGAVAYGCGLIFVALFLADVTSLAVGALRPENLDTAPELASALQDFEWLAMGAAAPVGAAMLVAFAVLVLRDKAIWPQWVGWLAVLAAPVYALRTGTLFYTKGALAADGVLGLYMPVVALCAWIVAASASLALEIRRGPQSR